MLFRCVCGSVGPTRMHACTVCVRIRATGVLLSDSFLLDDHLGHGPLGTRRYVLKNLRHILRKYPTSLAHLETKPELLMQLLLEVAGDGKGTAAAAAAAAGGSGGGVAAAVVAAATGAGGSSSSAGATGGGGGGSSSALAESPAGSRTPQSDRSPRGQYGTHG